MKFRKRSALVCLSLAGAICCASRSAAQGPLDFLQSDSGSKYGLDPVAPGDLLGVVTDADDRGVAGATVYLRPQGRWGNRRSDPYLQSTVTDDRGQYVFRSLEPGGYHLAAVKGARASRTEMRKWLDVSHSLKLDAEPVVLPLKPARQALVTVVDDRSGEPLPGVDVNVRYWDMRQFWRTDQEGQVHVEGLLPRSYDISAAAKDYARNKAGASLKGSGRVDLTIRLKPGAVLSGTVRDQAGEPLAGSYVHLRSPTDYDIVDSGYVSSDGEYRFEHAPAGRPLLIDASYRGYEDSAVTTESLHVGETRSVDVRLKKQPYGGAVAGVVNGSDGKPLAGAEVIQWGRSSSDKRVTYTDDEGRFLLDNLYPRRREPQIFVKSPGYASAAESFTAGTREEPAELTINLKAGSRIRGRVVDETGSPIRAARVSFGEIYFGPGEEVRTGADGLFEFDTLPADVELRVWASGYSERDRLKLPLNGDDMINVVMQPQGFVRGRVVDAATGDPITAFNVRLGFSPDRKPGDPSHGISTSLIRPGQRHSSPEGLFEIDDQAVGHPFSVSIDAGGYRTKTLRRVEAVRPDSTERALFEMRALDPDRLRTIAGVVVDGDGEPIANVQVRLLASVDGKNASRRPIEWYLIRGHNAGDTDDQLQQSLLASTDVEGKFRFEGVHDDLKIELAYWGPGVSPTRRSGIDELSTDEQQSLRIEAAAAATLIVSLDADKFSGVSVVRLNRKSNPGGYDPQLQTQRPDGDDQWTLADIAPGEYTLVVSRYETTDPLRGYSRSVDMHRQEIRLGPGEKRELHLDAPVMPTTAAKVLNAFGNALKALTPAQSPSADTDGKGSQ